MPCDLLRAAGAGARSIDAADVTGSHRGKRMGVTVGHEGGSPFQPSTHLRVLVDDYGTARVSGRMFTGTTPSLTVAGARLKGHLSTGRLTGNGRRGSILQYPPQEMLYRGRWLWPGRST